MTPNKERRYCVYILDNSFVRATHVSVGPNTDKNMSSGLVASFSQGRGFNPGR